MGYKGFRGIQVSLQPVVIECRLGDLGQAEPLEVEEDRAAGQRLAGGLQHRPLLRPRQHELPGLARLVHPALDRRSQFRCVLDFVQHDRAGVVVQKQVRVGSGVSHIGRRIEDHRVPLAEHVSEQGALTHLSGTGNHDDREPLHHAPELVRENAFFVFHD